jgi:exopolyphosphatase/guanosine-5'-triphosphate,3'-diphosphate pyrophosphatase
LRVAALDLGTNSTRLLVADVVDGRVEEITRRLTITCLGEDVDVTHRLDPAAIARVWECLDGYRVVLTSLGAEQTLAIATSAVRDAENGVAFLAELAERYAVTTRLLTGDDEASLTFRGVTSDRALAADTLIVDIGGGSTELVLGGPGGVAFATSLQIGCVRLTDRFLRSDPPSAQEVDACAAYVRGVLPPLLATTALGVAGTITTLAAIDLDLPDYDPERIHGHRISRETVERELTRLATLRLDDRRNVNGLEPARAPVIVAGVVILREIMDVYRVAEIEASECDILQGAALAAAELEKGPT